MYSFQNFAPLTEFNKIVIANQKSLISSFVLRLNPASVHIDDHIRDRVRDLQAPR